MGRFTRSLKKYWYWMLVLPWHHAGTRTNAGKRIADRTEPYHWFFWLNGWAWTIVGLVSGALVAPSLIAFAGLSGVPYQDALVIGVAVLAGFLVQLLAWCFVALVTAGFVAFFTPFAIRFLELQSAQVLLPMPVTFASRRRIVYYSILGLLPLAGVGYAMYRYFAWVEASQRSFTIALIGGLLVKTFLIPFIKNIVWGIVLAGIIRWLRGGKDTKKA